MRTRFLTKRGNSYVFQIRIPKTLDLQSALSPIRVRLGTMNRNEAQTRADIYAGFLRIAFSRKRTPMTVEQRNRAADVLSTGLSEEELGDRLFAAMSDDQKFAMVAPMLAGMNHLTDGDLGDDIGENIRDRVFDGLAGLGFDRATKTGALTSFMGEHVERSLALCLQSDSFARQFFGFPAKEVATPQQNVELAAIMEELHKQRASIEALSQSSNGHTAASKKVAPTFSESTGLLIRHIHEAKRKDHPDIGTIQRVSDTFQVMAGDKPVNEYGKREVQAFVNDLSFVTPNFLKKSPNATLADLKKHIAKQRASDASGLSRATIEGTYLDRVRTIIRHGCDEADVAYPLAGKRITIPERAAAKRERAPFSPEQLNRIFEVALSSGNLADTLLPLFGFTTGRRIGLLTHIRCEWLHEDNGAWVIRPRRTVTDGGRTWNVPFKTAASLKPFVLHQTFTDIGLIPWMVEKKNGWLFETLAARVDPADAAQKRMTRVFQAAGLNGKELQSFHSLRSTRIAADFDLKMDARLKRLQVGHHSEDEHERYAGFFTPEESEYLRHLPMQSDVDLSGFFGLDFDSLAGKKLVGGRKKAS